MKIEKIGHKQEKYINDPSLTAIVDRLVRDFKPESIYLFGSHARDTSNKDSDYDLLVVVSQSNEAAYRRAQRAQLSLWGIWDAADIAVLTRGEFDRRKHVTGSLPAIVLSEGTQVYAA